MFIELLSVICSNRGSFCAYLRLNVVTDANSEAFNLVFLLVQSARGVVQFDIDIHCVTRWSRLGVPFTGIPLARFLSPEALRN